MDSGETAFRRLVTEAWPWDPSKQATAMSAVGESLGVSEASFLRRAGVWTPFLHSLPI